MELQKKGNGKLLRHPTSGKLVRGCGRCCGCKEAVCGDAVVPTCECAAVHTEYGAICCSPPSSSVTVTFSTFTESPDAAGLPFRDVVLDLIDTLSGQTVTIDLDPIFQLYVLRGKVSQITDCNMYAWQLVLNRTVIPETATMGYFATIVLVGVEGVTGELGDDLPCWGHSNAGAGGIEFVSQVTFVPGDCCGPYGDVVMDAVDPGYINEPTITISQFTVPTCGACNSGDFASVLTFDLSQTGCYPGLPTINLTRYTGGFSPAPENVVLWYSGFADGLIGENMWWGAQVEIVPISWVETGEDCQGLTCCMGLSVLIEVYEITEGGDVLVALCNVTGTLCEGRGSGAGSYVMEGGGEWMVEE